MEARSTCRRGGLPAQLREHAQWTASSCGPLRTDLTAESRLRMGAKRSDLQKPGGPLAGDTGSPAPAITAPLPSLPSPAATTLFSAWVSIPLKCLSSCPASLRLFPSVDSAGHEGIDHL